MDLKGIEKEYFRLRPELYRFIQSKTRSHEVTEDILQDTIMEIIQAYQQSIAIRSDSFKAFLYKIATNKLIDDTRKFYRKLEVSVEELETDWEKGSFDKKDYSEIIFKIVNNILIREDVDSRIREVLRLRLIEGFKMDEISELLSFTRQTIHSDFKKGMELLRKEFEACNLTPEDIL